MDAITLHRLGRHLTELASDVVRTSRPADHSPAEQAVLAQLLRTPGATAAELVRATGFAQSHVSASIARLRERELVTAAVDTADARRLRLSLTGRALRGLARRLGTPVGATLRRALGGDADRAEALLAELADLLLADVRAADDDPSTGTAHASPGG